MKKNKLGLIGASGRMGQEVISLVSEHQKFEGWVSLSRNKSDSGFKNQLTNLQHDSVLKVDAWIDFSTPEAFLQHLPTLMKMKKPIVSGTTGWTEAQFKKLQKAGDSLPLFWSPNLSLGVAVLRKSMEQLKPLANYDFQIEEIHHRHKKDSPSGTALHLQAQLDKVITKKHPAPLAIRGGGVYGQHKVWALGDEEYLCFEHVALNRKVFARGALWAAERMLKKANGFYTFEDLLK